MSAETAPMLPSDTPGRYVRVTSDLVRPLQLFGPSDSPLSNGLVFVDLAVESSGDTSLLWEGLYEMPDRFAGCRQMVFRWPSTVGESAIECYAFLEEAARRADALGNPARFELLAPRVGAHPLHISTDTNLTDLKILRSLEVATLLRDSGAFLRGNDYHFLLPSGSHASCFIRPANAMRHPRDVWAFASWLLPDLSDRCGVLLDTSTLTPLAVQLAAFGSERGWTLGPTATLSHYPSSRIDVDQAVERATAGGGCVAVLSVDSTGATQELIREAMRGRLADERNLHIIVGHETSDSPASVWSSFEDGTATAPAGNCSLCEDPSTAFLVTIDDGTYYPTPNAEPYIKVVPSTAASASARFWELVDRLDAVEVEALPDESAVTRRAERTPLAVRVLVDGLREFPDAVCEAVARRRDDAIATNDRSSQYVRDAMNSVRAATVVLVDRNDDIEPASRVLHELGLSDTTRFAVGLDNLAEEATSDDVILVFSWGALTGERLKLLRVQASDACVVPKPTIHGLCLHARPPSQNAWRAAVNSFRPGVLRTLWLSYLPWDSPLAAEREMLQRLTDHTYLSRQRLHALEQNTLADRKTTPFFPLWGVGPPWHGQEKLRPTSIYGDELHTKTAFAAIGAAVHLRRQENPHTAARVVFDMNGIGGPYFDATIIACVLRWLRPREVWWGGLTAADQRGAFDRVFEAGGLTTPEMTVLVPELYIAAALGKLTPAAFERLEERYAGFLDTEGWGEGPTARAALELAEEARRIAHVVRGAPSHRV